MTLHDWLVVNCQYDATTSREHRHEAYGTFVEGFAVCDGYAKAYNDLLSSVGIEATLVPGRKPPNTDKGTLPQPHAWSCVTINGKNIMLMSQQMTMFPIDPEQ